MCFSRVRIVLCVFGLERVGVCFMFGILISWVVGEVVVI